MPITGHLDTFLYQYPGDPTSVSTTIINPPKGAIVLDTTNGVLYRKTSALGSNSGYSLLVDAGNTLTLTAKTLTAPVIADGLTASGSTANDFSASTATFKTSTGLNTLGGKVAQKVVATPVAAAGSSTSDAAALGSANIVTISSDSAAKGVKLVAGVGGDIVHVLNTSATAAILYPATGGTINGLAANAGVLVPASKGTKAVCTASDTWTTYDFAAKSTAA